jgi:hypothetical protein
MPQQVGATGRQQWLWLASQQVPPLQHRLPQHFPFGQQTPASASQHSSVLVQHFVPQQVSLFGTEQH